MKSAEAQRWGMGRGYGGRGYGRNYDDGNGDDNYDDGDDGNDGDDSSSSCTVYTDQQACPTATEAENDICEYAVTSVRTLRPHCAALGGGYCVNTSKVKRSKPELIFHSIFFFELYLSSVIFSPTSSSQKNLWLLPIILFQMRQRTILLKELPHMTDC